MYYSIICKKKIFIFFIFIHNDFTITVRQAGWSWLHPVHSGLGGLLRKLLRQLGRTEAPPHCFGESERNRKEIHAVNTKHSKFNMYTILVRAGRKSWGNRISQLETQLMFSQIKILYILTILSVSFWNHCMCLIASFIRANYCHTVQWLLNGATNAFTITINHNMHNEFIQYGDEGADKTDTVTQTLNERACECFAHLHLCQEDLYTPRLWIWPPSSDHFLHLSLSPMIVDAKLFNNKCPFCAQCDLLQVRMPQGKGHSTIWCVSFSSTLCSLPCKHTHNHICTYIQVVLSVLSARVVIVIFSSASNFLLFQITVF